MEHLYLSYLFIYDTMGKKKIVFLEEGRGIGGAETALMGLLRYLDKSGFEPLVILSCKSVFYTVLREENPEIRTVFLKTPSFMSTSWEVGNRRIPNPFAVFYNLPLIIIKAFKVSSYLNGKGISTIQTNDMYAHIYGGIVGKIINTPFNWWVQDIPSKFFLLGLGRFFLNFLGLLLPQKIIAISQAVKSSFSPLLSTKISLVTLGIDPERLESTGKEGKLKKKMGFSDSDIIVGMASRLVPWKGHEIFLESVSLLSKRNTNLKFLIVGGTTFGRANYLDRLKKISAKLGIAEKVVFTDFVYKVADMLSVIDILVHASIRPEPFGLDIVEAMFLGKVVVASDTGAPREIIDDDKDGILFKPADTVALAEILQRLLDLPQKCIELGENAKIKAKEKFTAERFAKDFEKVIKMSEVKS